MAPKRRTTRLNPSATPTPVTDTHTTTSVTNGFVDPDHPTKVYKVVKALYGLHQAPRACFDASRFQMSSMGELTFFLGLQVKQNKGGIFISQDKYVAEILKKFDLVNVKAAITPMETKLPLTKDEEAFDVDVHLYRSMIGSLMYLTASRPDIMYAVCVCSRFQVTPKTSHLNAVKRIFKYLKGKPNLGYGIPGKSPLDIWKLSLIVVDRCGSNLTGNPQQVMSNFLVKDLSPASWQARNNYCSHYNNLRARYVALYALTANPTIYDSLVKQFWQSAIASTKEDGFFEISATIDNIREWAK
ncbi:putative ribonuclease H-like domain-containing protein [Tanacetum coccineum]